MKGRVFLVGAGPGDPELLTVKASRLLQTADVVLYDELVSPEILKLASPTAQLHNVGKADDTEVLQAEIETQQAEIAVATQQNKLAGLWTALAVVVGNSRLPPGAVEGNLEANLPRVDEHQLLDSLLKESPELKAASRFRASSSNSGPCPT